MLAERAGRHLSPPRELHKDLDRGIVPKTGCTNYTVRQAAEAWLAKGLDGHSAKTIKKFQNVLLPILTVVGTRKGRELRGLVRMWALK